MDIKKVGKGAVKGVTKVGKGAVKGKFFGGMVIMLLVGFEKNGGIVH